MQRPILVLAVALAVLLYTPAWHTVEHPAPTAKAAVTLHPKPSQHEAILKERRHHQVASRGSVPLRMMATAYTHTGNRTKTEKWPERGMIAVDPQIIPLGTRVYVEQYGWATAEDAGGAIAGHKIDVFMETEREAVIWGKRPVTVWVYGH